MISAVMVDSREPQWVQSLKFEGAPVVVVQLEAGDVQVATEDGAILLVERKTPDDLLNTIRDERLLPQMNKLAGAKLDALAVGKRSIYWPTLLISGALGVTADGRAITERGATGWSWAAVQGMLLSVQEMGVTVTYCNGDGDFEAAVIRLAKRARGDMQQIIPPRPPVELGPATAFLAGLPGVGVERAMKVMTWATECGVGAGAGLAWVTDLNVPAPLGEVTRRNIRSVLGLAANQKLAYIEDTPEVTNV